MSSHIYEKNLSALMTHYPDLAGLVARCETRLYSTEPTGRKGRSNLIFQGTTPQVIFYDPEDPVGDVANYLHDYWSVRDKLLVLLGLGLGYGAIELLRRNKDIIRLIIIEKDIECLKRTMEEVNCASLIVDPRVRILAGCKEEEFFLKVREAFAPHFAGMKAVKFIPWPASIKIYPSYYEQVVKSFQQIANTYVADRGNDAYDTLVGYEHFFININEYLHNPGARYVKDFFKDKPAVVVATGPSLKKNVHYLKEIENSAVLLSADASLGILHTHRIYPHFVTTIERPPGFDAYYKGLKDLDKTVLAAFSFVHPTTLQAYSGPRLFFHRLLRFMFELGFEEDAIHMGMSTAHMAYEVARHMGCNPIILVGNDLAYDSSGKSHAPGFILGEKQPVYETYDTLHVPGNCEAWVKTCDGWLTGIRQYEKRIAGWEGTLINATEGGAKINGALVMPLKEAIRRHCAAPFNPREKLFSHLSDWKSPHSVASILKYLNRMTDSISGYAEKCKKLRLLLHAILLDVENSDGNLDPDIIRQINESIPHIEAVLDSILQSDLMKYFEEYFYTEVFPLLMEWQVVDERFEDPLWAKAYRIKLAEDFLGTICQLSISLKECLADGKKRLSSLT